MTDKVEALEAIRNLSEHATLAEIIETLSILEAIRRGEKAADEGRTIPHATVKALAEGTVRNLSEHATLAEIIEELSILEVIRRGQQAAEAGDFVTQAEAESRLDSWISKSAGLIPR